MFQQTGRYKNIVLRLALKRAVCASFAFIAFPKGKVSTSKEFLMKKLCLFACLCLLSACGFHLKGLSGSSLNFSDIYVLSTVEKPDASQQLTYEALLDALRESGVKLVDSEAASAHKLVVSNFRFHSREVAIGGDSGNSRELEISDSYSITLFKDNKNLGETTVQSRSNIAYSAGQFIGSLQEERNMHEQLARENAHSALRFIQTHTKAAQ